MADFKKCRQECLDTAGKTARTAITGECRHECRHSRQDCPRHDYWGMSARMPTPQARLPAPRLPGNVGTNADTAGKTARATITALRIVVHGMWPEVGLAAA
jgi:hypothetical protein